MRRANESSAFSIPVHEPGVKTEHVITGVYYLADRGVFNDSNRVRDTGNLPGLPALDHRTGVNDYFVICPARGEALYEPRVG
jgi:hypothetical protein